MSDIEMRMEAEKEIACIDGFLGVLLRTAHYIVDHEDEIEKIQRVLNAKLDETEDIKC